MTKTIILFMLFSSWLLAGHQEIGLKSEFAYADKLQQANADDMDSYGASRCICGDYGAYPLLLPGNELIVAFPTTENDEELVHIWNPSGFKEICGGRCGRSREDGRHFYYLSSQYLTHKFEIYEPRTKTNCWHNLFGSKGIRKIEILSLSTNHGGFSYNLNHESVDDLISEMRADMFLKYIIEPLLKTHGIELGGWSVYNEKYIKFKNATKKSKLDLKVACMKAHDLLEAIDQHVREQYELLVLEKGLYNIVFEDFNASHIITVMNKDAVRKIINYYLAILKTLIPEEDFKAYLDEDVTKLQYGEEFLGRIHRETELY